MTALQTGTIPPGAMYIRITSPLGIATVDPFAAAQDAQTQAIMQRLGIGVTIGFGPAPAPQPGEASLAKNLSIGLTLGLGALALALRPKLSTVVVVGAAALLFQSDVLTRLFGGPPTTEVTA